jgi:hypothetical protein
LISVRPKITVNGFGPEARTWRFACHDSGSRTLHAQHEQPAPALVAERRDVEDRRGRQGGHDVAERPSRLHDADGLVAMFSRPGFADEHRAGCPFATHAEPEQRAPEEQLEDRLRRRRAERRQREEDDRAHQGARAAESVGDVAERETADARHDQRRRAEQSGRGVVESEMDLQLVERDGIEHEVHGVEHPAELRRRQDAPLLACDRPVPGDRRRGRERRVHVGTTW